MAPEYSGKKELLGHFAGREPRDSALDGSSRSLPALDGTAFDWALSLTYATCLSSLTADRHSIDYLVRFSYMFYLSQFGEHLGI